MREESDDDELLCEALAYHNPADVEALKLAREALEMCNGYMVHCVNDKTLKVITEALAAIVEVEK